jgi:hypothetical protein
MSHDQIGPKERQLREMREQRAANKGPKKPSTSDLRKMIGKTKPMGKKTGRRGR